MTAAALVDRLQKRSLTLATAESCTGGLLGAEITAVAGSSRVYKGGVVCYANSVKINALGVSAEQIARNGAVSREVACEMAERVRELCASDVGVGITGVAGPEASERKPVGLVYVAVAFGGNTTARECRFDAALGRDGVRAASVETALCMLNEV